VEVESLFSTSKYIFDDRRLGTTPEHVEQQMFLKEHVEQQMFLKENHFLMGSRILYMQSLLST
jgi:hypothetical protein